MSLRRRLLAGLIGVAAMLVVTNVVLSSTIQRFLLDRLDRQLVDVASRPVFRRDDFRAVGGAPPGFPPNDARTLSEYFIAVGDPTADSLTQYSSAFRDENEAPLLRRAQVLANLTDHRLEPRPFTASAVQGKGSWRLVAVDDPRLGATVVGISLDEVDQTVERIRVVQVFGTMAVLAALGLISWWMLRLGVHPIEDMARTADAIAAGDLSQRVEHPGERTEAGRLGVALNSMLGRIEEAFRGSEASEARVRRFAADASHELRTPLTSIQGYAELWRAGGLRDPDELGEAMRRMEQEARRMGTLVEDLLLLARLDQRRPLELDLVRLDEIAADAMKDAQVVEPDRSIELVSEPVTVHGDEMRLRQVVGNLLANARAHTPPGTPVRVRVVTEDDHARLEVADQGPGMEPEVVAKVFERFYRADTSRARSKGGTGLGLSIVAAIAEAHGGSAAVSSTLGVGSTFAVILPVTLHEINPRKAVGLRGGAGVTGAVLLDGACGSDAKSADADASGATAATSTSSTSSTTVSSATTTSSSATDVVGVDAFKDAASCALTPEQTQGPYHIDVDKIRQDIREDRPGTKLTVAARVMHADACTPVKDAVFEIWHCDAGGLYSGFEAASTGGGGPGGGPGGPSVSDSKRYLRGAQVTNADGIAEIITIWPGWYRGRTVHIHAKVQLSNTDALTTQLYFDEKLNTEVFAAAPYNQHTGRDTLNTDDDIYRSETTLAVSKDGDGYLGLITLGIKV